MTLKEMVQQVSIEIEDEKHSRIKVETLLSYLSEGQKEVTNRTRILQNDDSSLTSTSGTASYTPAQSRILGIMHVYYGGAVLEPYTRDQLDIYEKQYLDDTEDDWTDSPGVVSGWVYDFYDSKIRFWRTPNSTGDTIRIISQYGPADITGINASFEVPHYCERAIYLYGLFKAQRKISVDYTDALGLRQSQVWQVHSRQNNVEYENAIMEIKKLMRGFQTKIIPQIQSDNGLILEELDG